MGLIGYGKRRRDLGSHYAQEEPSYPSSHEILQRASVLVGKAIFTDEPRMVILKL